MQVAEAADEVQVGAAAGGHAQAVGGRDRAANLIHDLADRTVDRRLDAALALQRGLADVLEDIAEGRLQQSVVWKVRVGSVEQQEPRGGRGK